MKTLLCVLGLLCAATPLVAASDVDANASISVVRSETLPALPQLTKPLALVAMDDSIVALGATGSWQLGADRRWSPIPWRGAPVQRVLGAASGSGGGAFVLSVDDAQQIRLVALRREQNELVATALPALPVALRQAVAARDAANLYVAGTDAQGAAHFLQLAPATPMGRWTANAVWPDQARPTSLTVRSAGLYLTTSAIGGVPHLLRWAAQQWQDKGVVPGAPIAGAARPLGQAHILYLLGETDGRSSLVTYNTIPGAWAKLRYEVAAEPLAVGSLGTGLLFASADGDGVRFATAELASGKRVLRVLDWIVIAIYLAAMVGIGWYCHRGKGKNTPAEFFVGSRSIPVWAAGISLYATNTSSISYIAIPAKAFETNWTYLANNLVTVLGLIFVATWVVPLLRRLDLVSVFSYLEMRFHPAIRMLASALCIAMQVGGRMSVVLFLPALAIAAITGIDVVWSVLIMGLSTVLYTTMGGMRAVIWTDFLQVIVMFGGALFAIGFVFWSVGAHEVVATALANDKTHLFDFRFDLTQATVWGFVVLMLLDVVLTFPKDQVLMQRALATKSDKSAGRSIWIFALMTIPGGFVFYGIGTALFAYYQSHPERMDPLLPIDATFPLFIAAELPVGVTGLIIAGIFSAAMSTLSGTINSVATLMAVDFYKRLEPEATQDSSLRFAEWMSVVIGFVGIGLALLLSRYDVHSLLDMSIQLAGLLGGGFAGAYTLGMFTTRANSAGVSIGIGTAIVTTLVAWSMDLVHPYFYLGISIFVCIVVGYLASLFFPAPTRSLEGLTIRADEPMRQESKD